MKQIGISIVEHCGSFLVGTRPPDVPLAGYSEFPGGKSLYDEPSSNTAVRECLEETHLRIEPVRLLHQQTFSYPHGEVALDFWHCRLAAGQSGDKISDPWKWVSRDKLGEHRFPPANADVLQILRSLPPLV
ncbi:NUDIX domain-containing protein [Rubinisphaera margarita]|uniref:NUDIX domain-containing protein n=1 Tax=Rubinisphaera margarita TaxID=2909586 RepID=UPI001EE7C4FF|nr:NUDIX domain-containing protein [Rubinisphaera margarita]MCG6158398.1 NUDIX domain-containing protein [Rubinisphaera margarita]